MVNGRAVFALLVLFVAGACGEGSEALRVPPDDIGDAGDAGPDSGTTPPPPTIEALREEISRAIAASACPGDPCPMVTLPAIVPGQLRPESRGKRILLIDDGILAQSAIRYRSRTLEFLRRDANANYEAFLPSFTLSSEAYAILKKLDELPERIAAVELNMAQTFFDKFGDHMPDLWYAHGSDIHSFLSEYVGGSQFVISEDILEPTFSCDLLEMSSTDAWAELKRTLTAMRTSLAEVITRLGVNYFSVSWGLTHNNLGEEFRHACMRTPSHEVTDRILDLYIDLFRSLTALQVPGADGNPRPVVLFHAGAPASPAEDYRLDCADIPGRVRVFSVPSTTTSVTCAGSHDYELLPEPWRLGLACNDIFVVLGYESQVRVPRPKYFPSIIWGLGAAPKPTWPPTSSFANPVALAYFARLVEKHPTDTLDASLSRLTISNSKPIVDPLQFDLFPGKKDTCLGGTEP